MTEENDEELTPAEAEIARVRLFERMWFTTHRPVSLELLVSTTVALRANYESDSHAADAALRLIDTCARLLEHNQSLVEREMQTRKIYEKLGLKPGDPIPFRDGMKIITGQSRAERAEADFISFLRADAKVFQPDRVEECTAEMFADLEKDEFILEYVLIARQLFEEYRETGLLEKKRRAGKKDLPEKTALDRAENSERPAGENGRLPDQAGDSPETP